MSGQKGRKPRKAFHRREHNRQWRKVWDEPVADVEYDGAPVPLKQGNRGWKAGKKLRRV
jgi:hypothetical protein